MAEQMETQQTRRAKYGLNVAVALIAAAGVFGGMVYIAGDMKWRADMTRSGDFSLKPQTKNILSEQSSKVRLVSLYEREMRPDDAEDYYQRVADLLEEYRRNSSNISVDLIDPKTEPSKLDNLIDQIAKTESGAVEEYKKVLADFEKQVRADLEKLAAEELPKLQALPLEQVQDADTKQTLGLAVITIAAFPEQLEAAQERIDRRMKEKIPNYRSAVGDLRDNLDGLANMLRGVVSGLEGVKAGGGVPGEVAGYAAQGLPRYQEVLKRVTELQDRAKNLAELKLAALRDSLRGGRSILVLGENGWRVLPFEKVFPAGGEGLRQMTAGQQIKRNFAGEQQISSALISLRETGRKKVAIVRPEGPPMASAFFGRSAPFMELAERLREMNFEVLEKDLSGQWAMQAQMQGMPADEPTDEELRDAVWVVLGFQGRGGGMMGGAGTTIAPKLKEHLDNGGSAMVLSFVEGDPLTEALQPLGVTVHTNEILVHDVPSDRPPVRSGDPIADAQSMPFIMLMTDYGDHPLTRMAQSLEGLLVPMVPVSSTKVDGVTMTPLLPFPMQTRAWAETDSERVMSEGIAKFDAKTDRLATADAPLYAGVAVERVMPASTQPSTQPDKAAGARSSRLVVIGNLTFATATFLNMPDQELIGRGILAPRLPGNGQLIAGSMYWLTHQDTMLEVAPSEARVSRIGLLGEQTRRVVGLGMLGLGVPLAVMAVGLGVWRVRSRD